jgi:hypothetical protein
MPHLLVLRDARSLAFFILTLLLSHSLVLLLGDCLVSVFKMAGSDTGDIIAVILGVGMGLVACCAALGWYARSHGKV